MKTPTSVLRLLFLACVAGTSLFLGGCVTATPSNSKAMVAAPASGAKTHDASVAIAVTGGTETNAMGASKISNNDFADAIRASIDQSKVFSKLAPAGSASDYLLEVQIVKLDQPMFGTSFTVRLEATWRLLKAADRAVVWEKAVESSFTATMGDAFVGVKRLQLANEGAARNNISSALTEISQLSF